MSTQERDADDTSVWQDFASQHSGSKWLELDPLYSIPTFLISYMEPVMRGLMSETEMKFEKALAEATEGGFFNGRRFGYPPLSQRFYTDKEPPRDKGWQKVRDAAESINGMLKEDLRERGISSRDVASFEKKQSEYDENVRLHQAAYAGWLVTDPKFRRERDALKQSFDAIIRQRGGFPNYPRSMVGESAFGNDATRQKWEEYVRFLQRWGLDTFSTWDLPVPMGMEANQILYKIGEGAYGTSGRIGIADRLLLMFSKRIPSERLIA